MCEWCQVGHFGRCPLHQLLPVTDSQPSIPEAEQDVPEQHLLSVLSRLTHHLLQDDDMVKQLVSSTALVGQGRTRDSGVEGKIHHGRKLSEVSEDEAGASSEHRVCSMGEHLTQTLVNLTEKFPSDHGHLVDDEVVHVSQCLLHLV